MARHGASLRAGLLQGVTFGVRGVAAVVHLVGPYGQRRERAGLLTFGVRGVAAVVHLVPGVPPFFGVGGADVVLRYDRSRVAAGPVVMGACQGGNV